MLKKSIVSMFAAAFVMFGVVGCTTVKDVYDPAEEIKVSQAEYELGKAVLSAFVANDAEKFINLLPEETRTAFNVETFKKTRKSITDSVGEPISFYYVTTLELPSLSPQVWKVRFKRENTNKSKVFTSELLFRIVTGITKENEAVVTSFQFL